MVMDKYLPTARAMNVLFMEIARGVRWNSWLFFVEEIEFTYCHGQLRRVHSSNYAAFNRIVIRGGRNDCPPEADRPTDREPADPSALGDSPAGKEIAALLERSPDIRFVGITATAFEELRSGLLAE